MKTVLAFILLILVSSIIHGQITYEDKKDMVQKVFEKIVDAYGNGKSKPRWELLKNGQDDLVIALYNTTEGPLIQIDEKLVDICLDFKADSLNALSLIISHELAHHYSEHNFCQDYAYAAGKKSPIYKSLLKYHFSDASRMYKEYEADEKGLFYATAAGYKPFDVFDALIDKVYKNYKLADFNKDYPSKRLRKQTNARSKLRAAEFLTVFKAGKILNQIGQYKAAADCFDYINNKFKSRENFNNAGVAKLRAALNLKGKNKINFIYPIEFDPVSRLQYYRTRSLSQNEVDKKYDELLDDAKKDFEAAKTLDLAYTNAYINLACIFDIETNYELARGFLNDKKIDTVTYMNTINMLKGIIWLHDKDTSKSADYFNKLPVGKDSIMEYNRRLFGFINDDGSSLQKYVDEWQQRNSNKEVATASQQDIFNTFKFTKDGIPQNIKNDKKITIYNSKDQDGIEIYINEKRLLRAVKYDTNEWIIKIDDIWAKENNIPGYPQMRILKL